MADVALGYDDVKGYDENGTYYGAFIGRNGKIFRVGRDRRSFGPALPCN